MDMRSFLESLAERLQSSAQVKMVYGEPVSAEGKTIIPVAKIRYGFGGGFGRSAKGAEEEGGGGGGGVTATPVGALEITAQETRFIHFDEPQRFLAAAAAGFLLGTLLSRRRKKKKKNA